MRIVGFIPAETVSAGIFEPPPEITKPEKPKKPSRRDKKKSEENEDADNSAGILET